MQNLFGTLGANERETKIFLKMLELGAQPVSVMAKHIGVPRTTMYELIQRLKHLQLIEDFEQNGIIYVRCIPAKNLEDLLNAKGRQIEQAHRELEEKLAELERKENKLSITPRIRFLEGKQGAMRMYEEVLKEKEFYAFFNPELVKQAMPEYIYKVGEALKEKNGKAKEFVVDCPEAYLYQKRFHSTNHQIKILPKEAIFPSDTIVCTNKLYMISYGENQISATEIINPSLAQTERVIFELLWEKIP